MTSTTKPTLTDAAGMGGIVAQHGFDYQRFAAIIRVPQWLTNPAFESLLVEGLEDFEARFFAPLADDAHVLERYQAKSAELTPAELEEVFEKFCTFDNAYPRRARLHALITPRLPSTRAWVARDPERVRRARPFYAPFGDIVMSIEADVERSFIDTYGAELGSFVAKAVEVRVQNLPDRATAVAAFGQALLAVYPDHDVSNKRMELAFGALEVLTQSGVGRPLLRAELVAAVEPHVGFSLPRHVPLPVRVRSDRNGTDEATIEVDAAAFSTVNAATPAELWTNALITPLTRAADHLHAGGVTRISLSGSYRLSTGFVLGNSFRSARGFEIEIATKAGAWNTDDHPDGSIASRWQIGTPTRLRGGELTVSIGVVKNPIADVCAFAGAEKDEVFSAFLPEAISSALMAQCLVAELKRALSASTDTLRPARLKLFILGPAALAVALGHRWNAMPETVLHEFDPGSRTYIPTGTIR